MKVQVQVQDQSGTVEARLIQEQLKIYNHEKVAPDQHRELIVSVRDEDNTLAGGLVGSTNWGWLYIRLLWVSDHFRGQGIGSQLIKSAEVEALRRGCKNSWIDTFNPKASELYKSLGYQVFGELPDFPPGKLRIFFKKTL